MARSSPHVHDFANRFFLCRCGRKAEEEYGGLATHPGKPTTERIWELRYRLHAMTATTST